MTDWNLPPAEIERRSFEIIDAEAPAHPWDADAWSVLRRMIHTSADFDYVTNIRMHPEAIQAGVQALLAGTPILTDTRMAQAGMPRWRLDQLKVEVTCLVDVPETRERAKAQGITRSAAAVDLAMNLYPKAIYAIGNAPTALFRLLENIHAELAQPALIIGLPVGFVNAAESKQALVDLNTPYITALGRKGGSNVAASVVNALAELALSRR